jgi:aconitase A
VVCHDILGQTALVDLAGLRDAIAEQGGDPAKVNPVVPTQLIVDHSLAVEAPASIRMPSRRTAPSRTAATRTASTSSNGAKTAFDNVDVIPAGNGIMHQINLEKMSPVIQVRDGVAFPDTCVGTDSHTPARRLPRRHRHRRRRPGGRDRHARPTDHDAAAARSSVSS